MQLVRNLFGKQKNMDAQVQAGVLTGNTTTLQAATNAKFNSSFANQQKTDPQKVFEHMCAANSLTIDSHYLIQALLNAEIIDKSQEGMLQKQIEQLMQSAVDRQGSKKDLLELQNREID